MSQFLPTFQARKGFDGEARFLHIEAFLTRFTQQVGQVMRSDQAGKARGAAAAAETQPVDGASAPAGTSGGSSSSTGSLDESQVVFDATAGHNHDGAGSAPIVAIQGVATDKPTVTGTIPQFDGAVVRWVAPGGVSGYTAPVPANYAWVNQGGAALTTLNNAMQLRAPSSGAADAWRLQVKAVPGAPYTVTAALALGVWAKGANYAGLVLRDSVGGGLVTFGVQFGASMVLTVDKWTSPTVFSANYAQIPIAAPPTWLQIGDDGVNRVVRVSWDGAVWVDVFSVARTDFITPDQVGFGANANHAAAPTPDVTASLLSWKEA